MDLGPAHERLGEDEPAHERHGHGSAHEQLGSGLVDQEVTMHDSANDSANDLVNTINLYSDCLHAIPPGL